ncbi:MAG: NAD(P)-dependent oxidoreductase [Acidimicrobiia bacterium]|nr:NAD(P)-dependent oxidoreductase [Acidimicrobiia bacterium]MDX2468756.1 NAD(P)-dependent oxidoreductase [Acidimicrobiia bacterium]
MKIGYAGMGIMGRGMAANLVRAGHDVTVWNRTTERTADLAAAGAAVAGSPAELADLCDITMVCVSDTPDVEAVTLGDNGLLNGLSEGKLVVDHSTISASATKRLAAAVAQVGADWVDAPVSGGSEGAEKGTLSIMAGGSAASLERAKPYMESYGSNISHVGPTGSGQMVKLVNQVLVVINGLAVSEALLLAEAGGLDLDATIEAVKSGAAGSWMLANRGPQIIERDWRPGFTIDLQQKDLRLVLESADELAVPLPATSLVFQMYRALQRRGLGSEGNHALVKALEEMAGLEIGNRPDH